MKTVILGIGNLLLADEGVGVHAAHALSTTLCPDERDGSTSDPTVVLDVGTAVLDALPALEEADRVIVLDAIKAGGEPGTVYRMPLSEFEGSRCIGSLHGFDITRVLAMTRKKTHPEVVVIGIEPAEIDWSLSLSPEVAEALPTLLRAVEIELEPCPSRLSPSSLRTRPNPPQFGWTEAGQLPFHRVPASPAPELP